MNIKEYINNNILYLDGGMGTLLQKEGLAPGEKPEKWNISRPDVITRIHRDYFDAGSNVVNTNTFGANILKFGADELETIVSSAIANARVAAEQSNGEQPKWVALDIGPTGRLLKPYGDLDFEDAVSVFAETVKLGVKYGADLIMIETMSDSYETKAALLAAKENSSLPVFVSNAYGNSGRLMTGASPAAMVAMLEGLGADAVGVNCSLGPKALFGVVDEYLKYASIPVLLKPNAGLPKTVNGKSVYDVLPDEFATDVSELIRRGVRIAGGCCGTTPEYISALVGASADITPKEITKKNITLVSSYNHEVIFNTDPIAIGDRIDSTVNEDLQAALRNEDVDHIIDEGTDQQDDGADILYVNVGLPDIDEKSMLTEVVCELQTIIDLPLMIDARDASAMETALRRYNGKAMVIGSLEGMDKIFSLVKKYGGVIVAPITDEKDLTENAERIIAEAEKYGIDKKDIVFDPSALKLDADANDAAALIKNKLGCYVLNR